VSPIVLEGGLERLHALSGQQKVVLTEDFVEGPQGGIDLVEPGQATDLAWRIPVRDALATSPRFE